MPKDSASSSEELEIASGNLDDTEAPKDSVAPGNKIEKARDDLDDKESQKDSVAPSDKIEKEKEYFLATSAEIDKTTKESIKKNNVTNRATMISQL